MSIHMFIDDDEGYIDWVKENPKGYVINCYRTPTASYLILHLGNCPFIASDEPNNWTTETYIKVCSDNYVHLQDWVMKSMGGELSTLCQCMN